MFLPQQIKSFKKLQETVSLLDSARGGKLNIIESGVDAPG